MIYDMQKVLQAFGRLVCGVTRKHHWSKARFIDGEQPNWRKTCRRCGETRPIRTRNRKKEKTECNSN